MDPALHTINYLKEIEEQLQKDITNLEREIKPMENSFSPSGGRRSASKYNRLKGRLEGLQLALATMYDMRRELI